MKIQSNINILPGVAITGFGAVVPNPPNKPLVVVGAKLPNAPVPVLPKPPNVLCWGTVFPKPPKSDGADVVAVFENNPVPKLPPPKVGAGVLPNNPLVGAAPDVAAPKVDPPNRDGAEVVAVPNKLGAGVVPNKLCVVVGALVPNKFGVVAAVEKIFPVEEGVPNRLGFGAVVPNKLGADVIVAPNVLPKEGTGVAVAPNVLPNVGADVAGVLNVLPNAGAVLGPGVPKVLPKTGAALTAGVPNVLPNVGAVDAAGVPNVLEPKPVKPLVVVGVLPNGALKATAAKD